MPEDQSDITPVLNLLNVLPKGSGERSSYFLVI